MIKFSLLCGRGHEFESWFQSGEAFETQSKAGHVLCPLCQAADVTKAIMAPAIASKSKGAQAKPPVQAHSQAEASQAEAHANLALLDPRDLELRAVIAAFRKRVFEQAEDVGMRFAEEARKISRWPRRGASDPRPSECRGSARLDRGGDRNFADPPFARRI